MMVGCSEAQFGIHLLRVLALSLFRTWPCLGARIQITAGPSRIIECLRQLHNTNHPETPMLIQHNRKCHGTLPPYTLEGCIAFNHKAIRLQHKNKISVVKASVRAMFKVLLHIVQFVLPVVQVSVHQPFAVCISVLRHHHLNRLHAANALYSAIWSAGRTFRPGLPL